MNSKRTLANDNHINFNDYLKNKNGIEIIKNLKSKNITNITSFISHEDFILITKSYFQYLYKDTVNVEVPVNLYDSNTSFILYEKLLSHLKDCNKCRFCKDVLKIYDCKELLGTLFPYGEYLTNKYNSNLYLHNKIDLDNICIQPDITNINECKVCSLNNNNVKTELYPSQNNIIIEPIQEIDNYEKQLKMNAYAIYPNNIININESNNVLNDPNNKNQINKNNNDLLNKNKNNNDQINNNKNNNDLLKANLNENKVNIDQKQRNISSNMLDNKSNDIDNYPIPLLPIKSNNDNLNTNKNLNLNLNLNNEKNNKIKKPLNLNLGTMMGVSLTLD